MHARNPVNDFLSRLVIMLLFGAGIVAVFVWYLPLIQRNQSLRGDIARQETEIARVEEDIERMMREARLFEGNSNTVERLLRENLGYCLPGETVIRFEAPKAAKAPGADHAKGR